MRRRCVSGIVLLLGLGCWAAEDAAKPPAKDYASGFAKLHALGLANVTNATYVKLTITGGHQLLPQNSYHDSLQYRTKRKGNAWLLEDKGQEGSLFIMGSGQPIRVRDQRVVMKEQQEKARKLAKERKGEKRKSHLEVAFSMAQAESVSGTWKAVDAAGDLKKLTVYLEKLVEKADDDPPWEMRQGGWGKLFLEAALFHQKGFKDDANRIAALLFETADDPRKVIRQAYEKLAQGHYDDVYTQFLASGNWQAYLDGMRTELAPFRTGWRKYRAIEHLCGLVEARIKAATPPTLKETEGLALTDEDHGLARALAEEGLGTKNVFDAYSGQSWLLGANRQFPRPPADQESAVGKIKKRGLDSFPLLIAMLEDTFLLKGDSKSLGGYHSYSFDNDNEQTPQQLLKTISHPVTRGRVAHMLLLNVLPIPDNERFRVDERGGEGLLYDALDWYQENKGKSREELALGYLEEGSSQQKQSALQYLIAQGESPARFTAIEDALLDDDNRNMNRQLVQQYVTVRGAEANEFVERFAAGLEKPKEAGEGVVLQGDGGDRAAKQRKQLLKQLRELVAAGSAEDLIAAYTKGEKTWQIAQPALMSKLRQRPRDEALTTVLKGAVSAEKPKHRQALIGLAGQIPHMSANGFGMGMQFGGGRDPDEDGKPLPIAPFAAQWRTLLEDERVVESEYATSDDATTIAVRAAWTVESLYATPDTRSDGRWLGELPDRGRALLRKRAFARLDGKAGDDLPPFPNPEDVDDDRRKALLAELTGAAPNAIPAILRELNWDEKLALSQAVAEDEPLCRKLAPVAHRIIEAKAGTDIDDVDKAIAGLKGKALTAETVKKVIEACKGLTFAESPYGVTIRRCGAGHGVVANAKPMGTVAVYGRPPRKPGKKAVPAVRASLSARGLHASGNWPVTPVGEAKDVQEAKPAKKAPVDDLDALLEEAEDDLAEEDGERAERRNKEFWENLEKLLAGEGNPLTGAEITFTCYNPVLHRKLAEAAAKEKGDRAAGDADDFGDLIDFE
ncbi:MAG: hypothetical protein HN742_15455 [Lentisphaerae bacterium]|jgi:hypothetical protein|nr:hypothetical protein [Lentisphaerota bacterium]MBT4815369.1 hypothetical protein [Lentisphaerota bacterium]MBT5604384.1 hypothetical protein [Lentisphaerota bacterium]MBT7055215.1 hypothetical protein [Lentisphaerota bacterium]MBT7843274.1 hypothetical protein [Lentisphaerota bacterium]